MSTKCLYFGIRKLLLARKISNSNCNGILCTPQFYLKNPERKNRSYFQTHRISINSIHDIIVGIDIQN